MKEIFTTIKAGLQRVETITAARKALETEQADLKRTVHALTITVGGGDAKAAGDLVVAKARQELLPGELQRNRAEYEALTREIKTLLPDIALEVGRAYLAESRRVEGEVREFLGGLLDIHADAHMVDEFSRQIVSSSKTVKHLDGLRNSFYSHIIQTMTPEGVISRAKYAVKACADVL